MRRSGGAALTVALAALAAFAALKTSAQSLRGPEPLDSPVTFFIGDGAPATGFRPEDRQLARWALEAWQRAAGGALELAAAEAENDATVRVYWVPANAGLYGEMRPVRLPDGRRGAEVFIRPDLDALGPDIAALARNDPLLRDTIVYLTCLHEIGHALGLTHTADFEDVMYFFGFGGDIPRFFGRYRERLGTRDDIAREAGLSSGDLAQLRRLYPLP